jgi:ClpP class serine protease
MKKLVFLLSILLVSISSSFAQTAAEKELIQLSMNKWQWMSDKDVDKLEKLFDAKAKFVHMSGTWKKDEELDIIKTGRIWYKKATVKDTAIEIVGNTAIVWNRITLDAIVREQVAVTEFTVTEVYQKQENYWKMLALTFSSVRDTHQIKH